MHLKIAVRIATLSVLVLAVAAAPPAAAGERIRVTNLDELPRFSYPVEGSVVPILTSDEAFAELAAKVRADIEGVLAKYEIEDAATLQGYHGVLARLDLLAGNHEAALAHLERVRELESKEAGKLTTGLFAKAWVAATAEADPGADFPAFAAAYEKHLGELVGALPWEVVHDEIEEAKGRAEIFSENLVLGVAKSQVDPAVAASGAISSDLVPTVVSLRYALEMTVPLKDQTIDVYSRVIAANKVDKPDIWLTRAYILGPDEGQKPVIVGIWDSGTDVSLFEGRLWTNPSETVDGADSDSNSFVDDVHGIAFDIDGNPSPFLLHPKGEMADRVDAAMKYTKGFMDLTSSIDSPEASELKRHLAAIEPDQVNDFLEELSFATLYMHGTHVAGIAVEDNPFARILVARTSFDYHNPPKPLTVETAKRIADSFERTVRYFRRYGVRVVNMSWGWSLKEIESMLEANGVGATPEERAALTRQIFGILSASLERAMREAENILFVTSAGNSDNDVEFDQMIPSAFDLPNLLVVGAVDQAGDPTSFTSQGRNVRLYANGFEVESYVPGGGRMAASGTSMSSPAVVNLAAKILAVEFYLTPAAVIDLILEGATPREGDEDFRLLHPKATMQLLEAKRAENKIKRQLRPDPARMEVE
ncbi:MAG TPA: S8 family serine peptidase [Candidatus Sulfomarinibacteraceae bacterium]|nr:S8 family serine peptidase [Candidatus Sulfomarinibacteraceae bacterium]